MHNRRNRGGGGLGELCPPLFFLQTLFLRLSRFLKSLDVFVHVLLDCVSSSEQVHSTLVKIFNKVCLN